MVSLGQLIAFIICYSGVLLIVCPDLPRDLDHFQLSQAWHVLKQNWWQVSSALLANLFGVFKFLSTRKIGQQVHASVKTMYLGLISLTLSVITLLVNRPEYFVPWKVHYSREQLVMSIVISFFFWATHSSLSISLEHVKAANVSAFLSLSVVVTFFLARWMSVGEVASQALFLAQVPDKA